VRADLTLEPGTVFAEDYRVLSRLSEGGQGSLYVVEQLSTKRRRALKLMLPELVTRPALRRRFEAEARIGARIKSDHVVEVIASGVEATTGTPWLVMELLEGEELGKRVESAGPLPPGEVREILGQVCHALGEAHRQGIIHRDLKPENVFLTRPRRRGGVLVKVIDFGVARIVAEAKTSSTTQSMLGTPLWMAPEQVTPGVPITPAADVWSLGLLGFYLLTARSFWQTAKVSEASVWRILNEVCVAPLPSARARAEELGCAGLLPEGFEGWFARCVDRDASKRYPDAALAFAGLEAVLGPEPEKATASRPSAEPVAPVGRHRAEPAASAVAAAKAPATRPAPARARARRAALVATCVLALLAVLGLLAWKRSAGRSAGARDVGSPRAP
jgi:serine/threonine protein kinase